MKAKDLVLISTVMCLMGFVIKLMQQDDVPCGEFFLIAGNLTNASLVLIGAAHTEGQYRNGRDSELCMEHLTQNHTSHVVLIEGYPARKHISCEHVKTASKPGRVCLGMEDPKVLTNYKPGRDAITRLESLERVMNNVRHDRALDELLSHAISYLDKHKETPDSPERKLIEDMIEMRKKGYTLENIYNTIHNSTLIKAIRFVSDEAKMMQDRNRGMTTEFFRYRNNFTVVPIGLAHVYPGLLSKSKKPAQELLDTLEERKEQQPYAVLGYKH